MHSSLFSDAKDHSTKVLEWYPSIPVTLNTLITKPGNWYRLPIPLWESGPIQDTYTGYILRVQANVPVAVSDKISVKWIKWVCQKCHRFLPKLLSFYKIHLLDLLLDQSEASIVGDTECYISIRALQSCFIYRLEDRKSLFMNFKLRASASWFESHKTWVKYSDAFSTRCPLQCWILIGLAWPTVCFCPIVLLWILIVIEWGLVESPNLLLQYSIIISTRYFWLLIGPYCPIVC